MCAFWSIYLAYGYRYVPSECGKGGWKWVGAESVLVTSMPLNSIQLRRGNEMRHRKGLLENTSLCGCQKLFFFLAKSKDSMVCIWFAQINFRHTHVSHIFS